MPAEIIHEHTTSENSGGGTTLAIGLILLIALFLLLFYGLPNLRNMTAIQVPTFQIPSKIDVNVN